MKLPISLLILASLSAPALVQAKDLKKRRVKIDFNTMIDSSSDYQKSLESQLSIEISSSEAKIKDKYREDKKVKEFIDAEVASGEKTKTANRAPDSILVISLSPPLVGICTAPIAEVANNLN